MYVGLLSHIVFCAGVAIALEVFEVSVSLRYYRQWWYGRIGQAI